MTETTIDEELLKTLVAPELQQHHLIPDEYQCYRKKFFTRFALVFYEDKIVVPVNLWTAVITKLHKGHPAIKKMRHAATTFWWPRLTEAIRKK